MRVFTVFDRDGFSHLVSVCIYRVYSLQSALYTYWPVFQPGTQAGLKPVGYHSIQVNVLSFDEYNLLLFLLSLLKSPSGVVFSISLLIFKPFSTQEQLKLTDKLRKRWRRWRNQLNAKASYDMFPANEWNLEPAITVMATVKFFVVAQAAQSWSPMRKIIKNKCKTKLITTMGVQHRHFQSYIQPLFLTRFRHPAPLRVSIPMPPSQRCSSLRNVYLLRKLLTYIAVIL